MVFQNPASAFNPVFTIGAQMRHVLAAHEQLAEGRSDRPGPGRAASRWACRRWTACWRAYPHQLSGGMLQRAMIASALLCRPRVLIADEPTTALDVTIEAQILRLIRRLQESRGFSVLFITHDLGVVRSVSDRVVVLYAGRVAEHADDECPVRRAGPPVHGGLMAAVPHPSARRASLASIPGNVPSDVGVVPGCAFAERCAIAIDRCRESSGPRSGTLAAVISPPATSPAPGSQPVTAPQLGRTGR